MTTAELETTFDGLFDRHRPEQRCSEVEVDTVSLEPTVVGATRPVDRGGECALGLLGPAFEPGQPPLHPPRRGEPLGVTESCQFGERPVGRYADFVDGMAGQLQPQAHESRTGPPLRHFVPCCSSRSDRVAELRLGRTQLPCFAQSVPEIEQQAGRHIRLGDRARAGAREQADRGRHVSLLVAAAAGDCEQVLARPASSGRLGSVGVISIR